MRLIVPLLAAAASVLALAGCNLVGQVQAGPLVGKLDKAWVAGGEADLSAYLDLNAGAEWAECRQNGAACPSPPEVSHRHGIASFTLQGTVEAMATASGASAVPALALLVGVASLDDSGAASDQVNPEARCPR